MFATRFGPAITEFLEQEKQLLENVGMEIWRKPELMYEEHFAHALLTQFLEDRGFSVERKAYGLSTAFRAEFTSELENHSGISVAILCEYDSLPEIGHACGHNLIAECGVASACAIKDILMRPEMNIAAKVVVLGCPAEEGGGGKIDLINAGAFDNIHFAMMVHPSSHDVLHTTTLAIEKCKVEFRVRKNIESCSQSSALDASVLAYMNVANARQRMQSDWRVHGTISDGGIHPDIFPEKSESYFFMRCLDILDLPRLKELLTQCAKGAAIATDCEVFFDWDLKPYLPMQSNQAIEQIFGHFASTEGIVYGPDPGLNGSSDMGNVCWVVPSIHPKFFIGEPFLIHSHEFQKLAGTHKAQAYCLRIAKIMALTCLELFLNKECRDAATREFSLLSSL